MMNKKGFSLLEMMIAVAILAAMSLTMNSVVISSLEDKVRVERRDDLLQGVRVMLSKLTLDLSQAFLASPGLSGQGGFYQTGMKGGEDALTFSTFSHEHVVNGAKDTDSVVVGYFLKKNERGRMGLYRYETQTLPEKLDEKTKAYLLLPDIKEFKLKYYDSNKQEWVTDWDSSQLSVLGRLPQAVEINITVEEFEDEESDSALKEYSFTTQVPLGLYKNEILF